MTRIKMALLLSLFLTGCGASGYPTTPADSPISISGETRIGVSTYDGNIAESDLTINFGL